MNCRRRRRGRVIGKEIGIEKELNCHRSQSLQFQSNLSQLVSMKGREAVAHLKRQQFGRVSI